MGPQTQELIIVLNELIDLLEGDGDTHWSEWMRRSRARLQSSDFSGITHLMDAYGGIGSFNDVIVCQRDEGDESSRVDVYIEKNESLTRLRSKAWKLADAITRSQEND